MVTWETARDPRRPSETLVCPVLQSLWVERTTLTLVQSLPGISRWFEVDKRELVSHAGDHALSFHKFHSPTSGH